MIGPATSSLDAQTRAPACRLALPKALAAWSIDLNGVVLSMERAGQFSSTSATEGHPHESGHSGWWARDATK
jgi:hypothetical protein